MAATAGDRRLRGLLVAGLIDSSGLAFGWTVFTMAVIARQGLDAAAAYQAAMLAGVALSAPFTRWVTGRVGGRRLLRGLALGEGACRAGLLLLLLAGATPPELAAVVLMMNVLAWTGYAAMRAEVSAVESGSVSLTRYALCVAASEALAAAVASFLVPPGRAGGLVLTIPVYAMALVPQWWAGGHARVGRRRPSGDGRAPGRAPGGVRPFRTRIGSRQARVWVGGGLIMLVAGGPVLLANALAFERYGRPGVAASALALTVGSLLGPTLSGRLDHRRSRSEAPSRSGVQWPLLGALMAGGWICAGAGIAGLVVAQALAGVGQTTFEGTMDDECVRLANGTATTASLSGGSAARALGGAVAVALLPTVLRHAPLGVAAAGGTCALLAAAVGSWLFAIDRPARTATQPVPPLDERLEEAAA